MQCQYVLYVGVIFKVTTSALYIIIAACQCVVQHLQALLFASLYINIYKPPPPPLKSLVTLSVLVWFGLALVQWELSTNEKRDNIMWRGLVMSHFF